MSDELQMLRDQKKPSRRVECGVCGGPAEVYAFFAIDERMKNQKKGHKRLLSRSRTLCAPCALEALNTFAEARKP